MNLLMVKENKIIKSIIMKYLRIKMIIINS